MAMSREEIFEKVRDVLVEALGVDDDEVTPEATLREDLGAESIDYLDIVFQLEKAFDIKIPQGELFPNDIQNNPDYVEGDRLTEAGLARLKEAMPHADLSEFEKDPALTKLADVFTVDMLVNFVAGKVETA